MLMKYSCYSQLAKSYVNLFAEAGVPPKRKLAKFYVSPNAAIAPGTPIGINHFTVGDYVDVYSRR
jgi:large subunit ribosomal protein L3